MLKSLINFLQYLQTWDYSTWIIIILSILLVTAISALIVVIKGSIEIAEGFVQAIWK